MNVYLTEITQEISTRALVGKAYGVPVNLTVKCKLIPETLSAAPDILAEERAVWIALTAEEREFWEAFCKRVTERVATALTEKP